MKTLKLYKCPACGYYDFNGEECYACGYHRQSVYVNVYVLKGER